MTITTHRLISAYFRREMRKAGMDLTSQQWGILVMLWNRDGLTQDELASLVCVDQSSMSRELLLMEKKGLITRRKSPLDARRKIISAADKALALQETGLRVARSIFDMVNAHVSPQDHAVCLNVLASLKKALLDADGLPYPSASPKGSPKINT